MLLRKCPFVFIFVMFLLFGVPVDTPRATNSLACSPYVRGSCRGSSCRHRQPARQDWNMPIFSWLIPGELPCNRRRCLMLMSDPMMANKSVTVMGLACRVNQPLGTRVPEVGQRRQLHLEMSISQVATASAWSQKKSLWVKNSSRSASVR
jgi:hypothetical protein